MFSLNEMHCRDALALLKLPFVRNYLLSPGASTDLTVLTNKAQRRNSVSLTANRVLTGLPAFETETTSNWVFTPTCSQGHIIVGCGVQELQIHSRPRLCSWRREGYCMRRFVFNSTTGHMLSVSHQSFAGIIDVTSFSAVSCSLAFTALLNLSALQTALDADLDLILLRRAIVLSFMYSEQRTCSRACSYVSESSSVDGDFSPFISMMAGTDCLYSGTGILQKVANRSRRIDTLWMNVRCGLMRLENAACISELWNWGILKSYHELPKSPTRLEIPQQDVHTFVAEVSALGSNQEYQSAGHVNTSAEKAYGGGIVSGQQKASGRISLNETSRIVSNEPKAIKNGPPSASSSTKRTPKEKLVPNLQQSFSVLASLEEGDDCVKFPSGPCSFPPAKSHAYPIAVGRIAMYPSSEPAMQSTYVSKRDKVILERRKRNRQSAARSNMKRKQAYIALQEKLKMDNERIKELEDEQDRLLRENVVLRELTKS